MSLSIPKIRANGSQLPEAAPPTNRTVNRYLRDTGSGVIARRPAPLVDHRDATRQVWTRAAGLATDMIRNSGRLKGAVDQVLADTVGVELVLNPRPDLSLLGYSTEEAAEWIATVKRRWKAYAWNPAECDLRGKLTIPEMVDIALRHEIAFGECLALHDYMPPAQRRHYGVETGVKTLMVTPSRLVQETSETQRLFQGVFHDENGRATAYKIRRSGSGAWQYDIFPSHDADGRKMVTHLFQHQDADDVRGISPLAASFKKELQAEMLDDATSQMAILQTLFAVTLTSNSPSAEAFEAIQAFSNEIRSDELKEAYAGYFLSVMKRAAENSVSVGTDPAVSHLALDEKLNFETPKVPGPDYQPFKASLGREAARAIGITYGAYSMDHSSATYSSVRMDSATIWPVVLRRRRRIAAPLPQSIYELWLEEEVATGRTPLKGGYEAFLTHRHALCSANWQGPAKPTADDQKSARASSEKIENGTSSLARECADLGVDADEVFAERLAEHRRYVDAGMVSPFERGSGPSKVVADTTAGTTGQ